MEAPFGCPRCGQNIDCVCAEIERARKVNAATHELLKSLHGLYQEEMLSVLEGGLLKAQRTERGNTEPEAYTKRRIARMKTLLTGLPRVPQGVEVEPVKEG